MVATTVMDKETIWWCDRAGVSKRTHGPNLAYCQTVNKVLFGHSHAHSLTIMKTDNIFYIKLYNEMSWLHLYRDY